MKTFFESWRLLSVQFHTVEFSWIECWFLVENYEAFDHFHVLLTEINCCASTWTHFTREQFGLWPAICNVGTLWSYRPLWSLKLIRFSQKWLWYPQIRISLLPCSALCKRLKWLIVKCFVFLIFILFVQLTKFHFCSWVCYDNNNNYWIFWTLIFWT